jgi:hypothetical protein
MAGRTLKDVIEPADLDMLRVSKKHNALVALLAVIKRLPEPRAYVSEPVRDKDGKLYPYLWDEGMEVLGELLVAQDVRVIEPSTVRFLRVGRSTARLTGADDDWVDVAGDLAKMSYQTNPFMWMLIAARVLQQVYVPDDPDMYRSNDRIRSESKRFGLTVRAWHPTTSRYPNAPKRWGAPPPKKNHKPSRP